MMVLVAVDESDVSMYALKWTLDALFSDSLNLTVVHVMQPFQQYNIFPLAGPSLYATDAAVESIRKAQAQSAAQVLSLAIHICKQNMVKAQTIIMEGNPKHMICQAVENMDVDLLVIGSRGLSGIKRAMLGSVSDYCAHHAKCATLIVKPPNETEKK